MIFLEEFMEEFSEEKIWEEGLMPASPYNYFHLAASLVKALIATDSIHTHTIATAVAALVCASHFLILPLKKNEINFYLLNLC